MFRWHLRDVEKASRFLYCCVVRGGWSGSRSASCSGPCPLTPGSRVSCLSPSSSDLRSSRTEKQLRPSPLQFISISILSGPHGLARHYPEMGIRCHFVKETRQGNEFLIVILITYPGYFTPTVHVHSFVRAFHESEIFDRLHKFLVGASLVFLTESLSRLVDLSFNVKVITSNSRCLVIINRGLDPGIRAFFRFFSVIQSRDWKLCCNYGMI
jgi:hypothetical protein